MKLCEVAREIKMILGYTIFIEAIGIVKIWERMKIKILTDRGLKRAYGRYIQIPKEKLLKNFPQTCTLNIIED